MKSIKTGIVVIVMLVVVYGVWQMINNKPLAPPQGVSDLMSENFPEVNFTSQGQGTPMTPPAVTAPGFGAQPEVSGTTPPGTMPVIRPPAPLTANQPAVNSPYPGGAGSDHHATHNHGNPIPLGSPPSETIHGTRQPAPIVSANPAPVVGASDPYLAGASNFTAGNPAPPEQGGSVYGQPQTGDASGSGWGDYDDAASALGGTGFDIAWNKVQQQLTRGELATALAELSVWYGSSEIPMPKRAEMTELLDQLAGAVIYSPEHLLEDPYNVRPGETLEDIALTYQVPTQLLANINGLDADSQPAPGTELKVLRGPFNALISLDRRELTLIVGGRYAGRFPVELGNDPQPRAGEFSIQEKETQRTFIDREGRSIAPGENANPYGPYWIGLDGSLGIHGAAPAPSYGSRASTGSIIVSPEDARDLFSILSEDSRVVIRQ